MTSDAQEHEHRPPIEPGTPVWWGDEEEGIACPMMGIFKRVSDTRPGIGIVIVELFADSDDGINTIVDDIPMDELMTKFPVQGISSQVMQGYITQKTDLYPYTLFDHQRFVKEHW